MKSKTKNVLSKEKIIKLVKINFGKNTEVGEIAELKGGMFNSAYLIEIIGKQNKVILKVSSSPDAKLLSYESNIMKTEVQVYRIIEEQTSVPIPKILFHDFSKRAIDSDYFFMTVLKGEVMKNVIKKLTTEDLDEIKKELGRYFAQIHSIKGTYFGYFTDDKNLQFDTWKDAFLHMVHMILHDGKMHSINLPYDRIENVLIKNASYLDEITEPSLVDYDLWAGNVFLIKQGEKYHVEGIIDFERAFWGDPYADFVSSFMIINDIRRETIFWKSYINTVQGEKVINNNDDVRLTMYRLYMGLIMTVETYRYGFIYGLFQKVYAKNIVMRCIKNLENHNF